MNFPRITTLSFLIIFLQFPLLCQELSIVSWNLKDFGQSRDDEEIRLIAQELRDADIVSIQEVVAKHPGGAKAVARLAVQLNRMGAKWDYRISDPTQSPSPHISERYAFLWKTSKVSITGGGPELISELASIVDREPYHGKFKTKQGDVLHIVNYHACTHKENYPERKEIKAISTWLLNQSLKNVIWAGDMNLVISDPAFKKILAAGFKSVLNGEKTSLKMKCSNGQYLSRAEDNVLIKVGNFNYLDGGVLDFIKFADCEEVSWKRNSYSDHLGVKVNVGL